MNTAAQLKQAIKKSARQMVQEPLEILRSISFGEQPKPEVQPISENEVPQDEQNYKKQVIEQDGRHLQALESELKDIRRQKIFNDLMRRIQAGEDIPLEEFTELSYEQRDVLKAQIQAVRNQNAQTVTSTVPEPTSKRGRKMGGGQKGAAKREETRVEKPVPPSG